MTQPDEFTVTRAQLREILMGLSNSADKQDRLTAISAIIDILMRTDQETN